MSFTGYDPTRTYLVDSYGTSSLSYLVRGNEPLEIDETTFTFAYNAMNTQLQSSPPHGIGETFDLKDYHLLDVSVIDDTPGSEAKYLMAEFAAYGITDFGTYYPPYPTPPPNPPQNWPPVAKGLDVTQQNGTEVLDGSGLKHPGSIVWYPVQGCTGPDNCAQVEPTDYKFIEFVDFLRNLLETQIQTVIYFHCLHGDDRTSATHASYLIKYHNTSLTDAMTLAPPNGAKIPTLNWESDYIQLVDYFAAYY